MRILYIGDVMGDVGLRVVENILPSLRHDKNIDLVIAQAENVTDGKGTSVKDFRRLQQAGVDFCTGGNWSLNNPEIHTVLDDPNEPITRPANYPYGEKGLGYKYVVNDAGKTLVISLLGKIVGKDADVKLDNPLKKIDEILRSEINHARDATVVNFHGDYSSEKVVIGDYLDGRVTAVVGDHWHIPTADYRVLPKGTAHITDVGMCGTLDSSLGVTYQSIITRWRDDLKTRNVLATEGPKQFNAVLIDSNNQGLANSIEQIRIILD
jgi:metallophosphoesterase (TIGR00282 family)